MMEQEFNDVGDATILDNSKVDSVTTARFTLTQLLEHKIGANLDPKGQVGDITKANDIKLESLLKANSNFCCKNIRFAATPDVSVTLTEKAEDLEFESLETYNCNQCAYESKSNLELTNHSNVHRPASERIYKCGYCPHKATTNPALKSHLRKTHPDLESCSYITKRVSRMLVHKKPLSHKDSTGGDTLECHLCTYKAKQKRHLKLHLTLHETPADSSGAACNKSESECDSREFSVKK